MRSARVECKLAEPIPIILTVGAAAECRAPLIAMPFHLTVTEPAQS